MPQTGTRTSILGPEEQRQRHFLAGAEFRGRVQPLRSNRRGSRRGRRGGPRGLELRPPTTSLSYWAPAPAASKSAHELSAGDGPAFVIGARLNADSFADLAVANQNSNNVSVLLNTETQPPPPETTITKGPPNPDNSTSATFEFSSSEPGSTFPVRAGCGCPLSLQPCTSQETVPS